VAIHCDPVCELHSASPCHRKSEARGDPLCNSKRTVPSEYHWQDNAGMRVRNLFLLANGCPVHHSEAFKFGMAEVQVTAVTGSGMGFPKCLRFGPCFKVVLGIP